MIKDLSMETPNLPTKIGPYQVLKSLGKGGMGEVFLVFDPLCERKIALKKILPELAHHAVIKKRFLREARFASQLAHPCIIPIHSICSDQDIYYTMPYVEGETLKEIFKNTLEKERQGLPPHEIGTSIPTLARIFLSICQATAYAYSKSILHRDIKPENIIVGKYGEVFLLDWGIATYLDQTEDDHEEIDFKEHGQLTRPGKVLGTVNFMSPERALKKAANMQSEIYALGIILYQILTLRLPFARKNLEHFRKIMKFEILTPPEEAAPYRDIPKQLSKITQKCLAHTAEDRYQTLQEMLFDLENYIEGHPEWMLTAELNIEKKEDWEFQENILLSKHLAITRLIDAFDWVGLMISKEPFSGNLRLEFELKLPLDSDGVGFLLCVPEPSKRKNLEEGYCLWIGSATHPYTTLFRSNAEIMSIPDNGLYTDKTNHLCIEKIDQHVRVYINGHLKLNYVSHLPIIGSHVGFIYKNPDLELSTIRVYTGSQNVMVNCLSIPDAFLGNQHFDQAFIEYKKIASSFAGRYEGREAQFRSGITLLEQGKKEKLKFKQEHFFSKALDEFEQLKTTPLEYLGKSLVYYALNDVDEELKCLELALRKYPKHPLLSIVKEQILFRLHETSKQDRIATYGLALLVLRHVQGALATPTHKHLIFYLIECSTPLAFIDHDICFTDKKWNYYHLAISIAFWTYKPLILVELIDSLPLDLPESSQMIANALFCLLYMGCEHLAKEKLEETLDFLKQSCPLYFEPILLFLSGSDPLSCLTNLTSSLTSPMNFHSLRSFTFLMTKGLSLTSAEALLPFIQDLSTLDPKQKDAITLIQLEVLLKTNDLGAAGKLFANFSQDSLHKIESPFYFLYGCYLWKKEGESSALKHFSLFSKSFPLHPNVLIARYLTNIKDASLKLFFLEILDIYRKLSFLYSLIDKKRKSLDMDKKIKKLLQEKIKHSI